jgi:Signal transduction histidine kinase
MKKRIYFNMLILTCLGVALTSMFLAISFYTAFAEQVKNELQSKAEFLKAVLNLQENQSEYMESLHLPDGGMRLTLISENGTVLYDNIITDESGIENHAEREEIKKTVQNGFGEGKRRSETLGEETYYYAILLANGSIIRTAKTTASIYGVFIGILPQSLLIIAVVLFASLFGARSLTKKIISPINRFDFGKDTEIYEELSPFVRTIILQKEQIGQVLEEITKKSAVMEAITGSMNEGMILTGRDGTILSANESAVSILDIRTGSIGKNMLEATRDIAILEHMQAALSGENTNITLDIAGKTYHVFFSAVTGGALILFLDITEKARAEKMRREFTANVSHELKTPLTTISGYAELMSNHMVKAEDVADISGKVKKESERLLTLIEDIMRISELDEVGGEKHFEQFDLTALISEVAETLRQKADREQVTLHVPKETHVITANRPMVFELLYNLIDNAVKYNVAGGSVTAAVTETDKGVQISVKDTGIGIDKKHHDRIFERFYRVDKSRSKKNGGTGLGLSIVKHIAAHHGGSVDVQSAVGVGTEVYVWL